MHTLPTPHPVPLRRFAATTIATLLCATLLVTGCAGGKPMALEKLKSTAGLKQPIGLFTLRTENHTKPGYQAHHVALQITSGPKQKKAYYAAGKPSARDQEAFSEFLISVALEPGSGTVGRVIGRAGDEFLIAGHFDFHADCHFDLPPGGITYLGHIDMISRPRKEGEPRSGPLVPLVDQAVTGYSSSSMDVTVSDRSETDIAAFINAYPVLQGVTVSKAVMTR